MKICKNCGAEYDIALAKCPYCGYENVEEAQKKHSLKIRELIFQREAIRRLPKHIIKKAGKICLVVMLIGVAVLGMVFLGKYLIGKWQKQKSIDDEAANTAQMELLLEQKDYSGLYEYYQALPYASETYETYRKYREVCTIYSQYQRLEDRINEESQYSDQLPEELLLQNMANEMQYFARLGQNTEELLEDDRHLGNEEYLMELRDMGKELITDSYLLSDEMTEQLLLLDGSEDLSVYEELARTALDSQGSRD